MASRKVQAAVTAEPFGDVVVVGVMQRKHQLGKGPRRDDGQNGKCDVSVAAGPMQVLHHGQFRHDGADACHRGRHHQDQHQDAAFVVLQGAQAHSFVAGPEHHARGQDEVQACAHVPADDGSGHGLMRDRIRQPEPDGQAHEKASQQPWPRQQNAYGIRPRSECKVRRFVHVRELSASRVCSQHRKREKGDGDLRRGQVVFSP